MIQTIHPVIQPVILPVDQLKDIVVLSTGPRTWDPLEAHPDWYNITGIQDSNLYLAEGIYRAKQGAFPDQCIAYTEDEYTDVELECTLLYASSGVETEVYFLVVRMTDFENFVGVTVWQGRICVYERKDGVWTGLITDPDAPLASPVVGEHVHIKVTGSEVELGALDGVWHVTTSVLGPGRIGMISRDWNIVEGDVITNFTVLTPVYDPLEKHPDWTALQGVSMFYMARNGGIWVKQDTVTPDTFVAYTSFNEADVHVSAILKTDVTGNTGCYYLSVRGADWNNQIGSSLYEGEIGVWQRHGGSQTTIIDSFDASPYVGHRIHLQIIGNQLRFWDEEGGFDLNGTVTRMDAGRVGIVYRNWDAPEQEYIDDFKIEALTTGEHYEHIPGEDYEHQPGAPWETE